jgi:hypothetical protein
MLLTCFNDRLRAAAICCEYFSSIGILFGATNVKAVRKEKKLFVTFYYTTISEYTKLY